MVQTLTTNSFPETLFQGCRRINKKERNVRMDRSGNGLGAFEMQDKIDELHGKKDRARERFYDIRRKMDKERG